MGAAIHKVHPPGFGVLFERDKGCSQLLLGKVLRRDCQRIPGERHPLLGGIHHVRAARRLEALLGCRPRRGRAAQPEGVGRYPGQGLKGAEHACSVGIG